MLNKGTITTRYFSITNSRKTALCKSTNVIHRAVLCYDYLLLLIGVPIDVYCFNICFCDNEFYNRTTGYVRNMYNITILKNLLFKYYYDTFDTFSSSEIAEKHLFNS